MAKGFLAGNINAGPGLGYLPGLHVGLCQLY